MLTADQIKDIILDNIKLREADYNMMAGRIVEILAEYKLPGTTNLVLFSQLSAMEEIGMTDYADDGISDEIQAATFRVCRAIGRKSAEMVLAAQEEPESDSGLQEVLDRVGEQ
jgi:hypothetical protein